MNDFPLDLNSIKKWYVYTHHHIDDLSMIPSFEAVLEKIGNEWGDIGYFDEEAREFKNRSINFADYKVNLLEAVKSRLTEAGWEGDGEIGVIWIPPFLGGMDNYGCNVFHVKQSNNGTSFIASPYRLPDMYLDLYLGPDK